MSDVTLSVAIAYCDTAQHGDDLSNTPPAVNSCNPLAT
jgi:hypothetical protein